MKNMLSLALVAIILVVFSAPSFAMPRPVEKIKDGVITIVKSPLEVKDHALAEVDKGFKPLALTGGILKGTFYMAKKAVDGAWEVATFPLSK